MASAAQIAANRQNAQKSTGPRTPEGKAASSQNALKHGLCAERLVLAEEDEAAWEELRADYRERYQPAGAAEERLADRIAQLAWRRDRGSPAEAAAWREASRDGWRPEPGGGESKYYENVDPLIAGMGAALANGVTKELARITLYESRLTRELQRLKAELAELQQARRRRAEAAEQAAAARKFAATHAPLVERAQALAEAKARAAAVGAPPPPTLPGSTRDELKAFLAREAERLAAHQAGRAPAPAAPGPRI